MTANTADRVFHIHTVDDIRKDCSFPDPCTICTGEGFPFVEHKPNIIYLQLMRGLEKEHMETEPSTR